MLPYLAVDAAALMQATSAFVAVEIRRCAREVPDIDRVAEAIIRCSHSVLLIPTGNDDLRDPTAPRAFMRLAVGAMLATASV